MPSVQWDGEGEAWPDKRAPCQQMGSRVIHTLRWNRLGSESEQESQIAGLTGSCWEAAGQTRGDLDPLLGPLSLPAVSRGPFSAPETTPFPLTWPNLQGCDDVLSPHAENFSGFPSLAWRAEAGEHTLSSKAHATA